MCSSPVMLGGGKHIANFGLSLVGSAMKRPSVSQRAYQPASMACGSNAFGISVFSCMGVFDRSVWFRYAGRWPRLARRSRRGYGYAYVAAHGAHDVTAAARQQAVSRSTPPLTACTSHTGELVKGVEQVPPATQSAERPAGGYLPAP